jgi:predicted RNA-binding Zn-ribbon protein involved in translation (DUF1610 family)
MGMFDTVLIPCPTCGQDYPEQTKAGACLLEEYTFDNAPPEVLASINQYAPFTCDNCGTVFAVHIHVSAIPYVVKKNIGCEGLFQLMPKWWEKGGT